MMGLGAFGAHPALLGGHPYGDMGLPGMGHMGGMGMPGERGRGRGGWGGSTAALPAQLEAASRAAP